MATQKLDIIDNHEDFSDGLVYTRDKELIGYAYQNEAPVGHYIAISLDNHWIITDEEYKLLKEAKKNKKHE